MAVASYGYDVEHPDGDLQVALESMITASVCLGTVRHLIRTVSSQAKNGRRPVLKRSSRDGRDVVHVFPFDRADKLSPEGMSGYTGEVWLRADTSNVSSSQESVGQLCLVLGAGNQSCLAFCDVMYQLFVEGSVCLLKHHPLRSCSVPYFDEIFADLIEQGFFYACEADTAQSQALVHHPLVDRVHMTGGTATHDAIVWGSTAEKRAQNKAANTPVLNKPMSSELGCITPWVVVPGTVWSPEQINHMAGHLVAAFVAQNSCNCLSPKLLVLDADWPQRGEFLDAVRAILRNTNLLPPHYPGTAERYAGFEAVYSDDQLERIDAAAHPGMREHDLGPSLPWLLVQLDENSDPYALEHEAFAPVLGIYTLSAGNDPDVFVDAAVPFLNGSVWGSLSCTLIAHPDLAWGPESAVERAIGGLHYGTVSVNTWTATAYGMSGMTWGAYPGEDLANVASGIGVVRNAYALSGVEKSVLRAPFQCHAQLVIEPSGAIAFGPSQFRAVRQMIVKPGLGSLIKMVCEIATPQVPHDEDATIGQRCVTSMLGGIGGLVDWFKGDRARLTTRKD